MTPGFTIIAKETWAETGAVRKNTVQIYPLNDCHIIFLQDSLALSRSNKYIAFSHRQCCTDLGYYKLQRPSKLYYWFKRYKDFEQVNFVFGGVGSGRICKYIYSFYHIQHPFLRFLSLYNLNCQFETHLIHIVMYSIF